MNELRISARCGGVTLAWTCLQYWVVEEQSSNLMQLRLHGLISLSLTKQTLHELHTLLVSASLIKPLTSRYVAVLVFYMDQHAVSREGTTDTR